MADSGQEAIDHRIRAEAVRALGDALASRLTAARWRDPVERILDSMAAALAGGDSPALRRATISLEVETTRRVTALGAGSRVPPPEPVRQRLAYLVHALGGVEPASPDDRLDRPDAQEDERGRPAAG